MNTEALKKIGYGLYVICSRKDDKFNGQIANTVFQITAQPPTIAVSINKKNLTHEFIKASRVFTASVLCQETPLTFIGRFGFKSGRELNKLEGVSYKIGVTKAPIVLDNAVSYLETNVIQEIDVGTHTIFIGEVVSADVVSDKSCMTYDYYQQVKRGTTPTAAPSYVEPKKVAVKKEAPPEMAKYQCRICGYIYDPKLGDPDSGIKLGTPFEELPDSWTCPVCGAAKNEFERIG